MNKKSKKKASAKLRSQMPRSGKILLITFVSIILALIITISTLAVVAFLRLKSVHDPDVHFSDRSGEYSVPLTPSGIDLSPAESFDESDWHTSTPFVPDESTSDVSEDTSQPTVSNGDGGNWTWTPKNVPIITKDPIDENIINILILGVDSMDATESGGRSDTMIVVSYNKTTGEVNLISLLRDSFVPIEGYSWNRLNAAYFFGSVGLCINTINDVFELDIQNYVMVDFNSLPTLIDKIGGVEIELNEAEVKYYKSVYGWDVEVGTNLLDGDMALKHARNRSVGFVDFDRTSRQRDILTYIINDILNSNDLVDTISLINSSLDLIRTNLAPGDIIELATTVYGGPNVTIGTMQMPIYGTYEPKWYGNMLVMSIDIQENRDAIRETLYGS